MPKIRIISEGYIKRLIMAHPYHKSPPPKNCMESSGLKFFSYIELSH